MTQSVVDDVLIGPEVNRCNGLIFIASNGLLADHLGFEAVRLRRALEVSLRELNPS